SGARIMATLVHEMKRWGARYGRQTMWEGGGMANATILELAESVDGCGEGHPAPHLSTL
ncbi:MAG: hypothetical protein ACR2N6_01495, partial [Miltoncostaeaceae bacterium]